jgi:hypothetical protein
MLGQRTWSLRMRLSKRAHVSVALLSCLYGGWKVQKQHAYYVRCFREEGKCSLHANSRILFWKRNNESVI